MMLVLASLKQLPFLDSRSALLITNEYTVDFIDLLFVLSPSANLKKVCGSVTFSGFFF